MTRLLLISRHFPPEGGGGVQRAAKLAKYLARDGHRVTVLAAPPQPPIDDHETLPPGVQVHRLSLALSGRLTKLSRMLRLGRVYKRATDWTSFGDRGFSDLPEMIRSGVQAGADARVVIATSLPFSSVVAGAEIARRLQRPFIADLRDPWAWAPRQTAITALHRRGMKRLERSTLSRADAVVIMTERTRAFLDPAIGARAVVIPNGYDPEDLNVPAEPASGKFRIVHAGSLYKARSPEVVLRAIEGLGETELVIAGNTYEYTAPLRAAGVDTRGYLSHRATVGLLRSADAILVLVGVDPPEEQPVPAKLYEAAAAGPPVICWARPTSEAAAVVRATGCGVVASNAEEIGRALKAIRRGEVVARPLHERPLAPYQRPTIARRYAELIASVV